MERGNKRNPKEKATELVGKFESHADWNNEYGSAEKQANIRHAKQCAIIAVDEILQAENLIFKVPSEYNFWGQVKSEIDNL